MNGSLRFVFALWVAVTLVVAPPGVVRAASCDGEAISVSMSEVHSHGAAMVLAAVDTVHAGKGADRALLNCGLGHVCCSAVCFGPIMTVAGTELSVMAVTAALPHRTEPLMPDGIASVPPLAPPRPAI